MLFHLRAKGLTLGLVCTFVTLGSVAAFAQSPPSGVWALAQAKAVNLNWNFVAGASFNIYRGTTAGGEGKKPIASVNAGNYQDTTAAAGTAYYYKITSVIGTKESGYSAETSCTPGTQLGGVPNVVTAAANARVTIYWSSVTGATFYRVFRYNPYQGWQQTGLTSGLSFSDSTVQNGTEYVYQVLAADAQTDAANPSNNVTAVPGDQPLSAPKIIWTVAPSGQNNLSWTPTPGAGGYVIYRSLTSGGEGTQPYAFAGGNGFTDDNVTNGTTYYYKVAALDYTGTGNLSAETSGTPNAAQLQGGYMVAKATASAVAVTWQPTAGATSYYLVRGDGNLYNNQTVVAHVTGTTFTDTAVAAAGTYVYQALPADTDGEGLNNYTATAKVGDPALPVPTGLYVTSQPKSLNVSWNLVAGTYFYAVYRSSDSSAPTLYDVIYGGGFTDTNVTAGTTYTYQVASIGDTESGLSTSATGQINATPLPAPVATGTAGSASTTIYWSLVTGATSYDIFRVINGQPAYIVGENKPGTGATAGTFTDATAPKQVDCTYWVVAVNDSGVGKPSNNVFAADGDTEPPAPSGTEALPGTYNGGNAIFVNANPVPGVQGYNLYRSTTPGGEGVIPYVLNTGAGFVDTNITPGVTYYYYYTSVDANGQSVKSPECWATYGGTALPAPILTAYTSATSISLDWSAVTGASGYDVFRAVGNSGYSLYQQNVKGVTFTDTNVSTNETVSYEVYPIGTQGLGNRSNSVSGRAGSTAASVTTGIFAVPTASGVTLSWNSVQGNNVSYNVFRSTTSKGEGLVPIAVNVNGNGIVNFTDASALAGTVYYYKVTTVTQDAQSTESVEVSAKAASTALAAPTLTVSSSKGKVVLTWTAVTGATSYNLFRTDPVYGYLLYQQGLTGTTFTDTAVTSGLGYQYYVAAVATNGQGLNSNNGLGNP